MQLIILSILTVRKLNQQEDFSLDYSSIGKNIRQCRQERRLSQEQLAERVNVSANYIGMIERGEKIPSLETFLALTNALETSADRLLWEVLKVGYQEKSSQLSQKLATLSPKDRQRILAVVDTLIAYANP